MASAFEIAAEKKLTATYDMITFRRRKKEKDRYEITER